MLVMAEVCGKFLALLRVKINIHDLHELSNFGQILWL
jgi:hypothetical protein